MECASKHKTSMSNEIISQCVATTQGHQIHVRIISSNNHSIYKQPYEYHHIISNIMLSLHERKNQATTSIISSNKCLSSSQVSNISSMRHKKQISEKHNIFNPYMSNNHHLSSIQSNMHKNIMSNNNHPFSYLIHPTIHEKQHNASRIKIMNHKVHNLDKPTLTHHLISIITTYA